MSWPTKILLALGALLLACSAAQAATIPVTTPLDGGIDGTTNDGLCSLREAVLAARLDTAVQGCPAGSGADTVVLGAGVFTLSVPGANEIAGETGDLNVGGPPITVAGAGAGSTLIVVATADRAFDVLPGGTFRLEGVAIRGGTLAANTGANGGAIRNQGALALVGVLVEAGVAGGGGFPGGDSSSLTGGGGGAIWSGNAQSAAVTIADSTFRGNAAGGGGLNESGNGGAIRIESGTLSISGSTFDGNAAGATSGAGSSPGGSGGAVAVGPGSATIVNSTFASNRAGANPGSNTSGGNGGAIWVAEGGSALVESSTFAGNVRGSRSLGANGIHGTAFVGGSILADAEPRCSGITTTTRNLLSAPDATCPVSSIVGDPRLGPLGANGGPTPTMLPGPGSAAVNALAGAGCPGTDQRGLPRPALGACDAGAVEVQPGAPGAPGAGGRGGAAALRGLNALKVGPAAFRAVGRKPLGTTITFRLSAASKIVLTVQKSVAGKKSGRRCVAPSKRLRSAKRCVRKTTLPGKVTKQGTIGLNLIKFSGKLRGRPLAPGPYTLALTLPRLGATRAVTTTKAFRILR
jgi:hypothetical protein